MVWWAPAHERSIPRPCVFLLYHAIMLQVQFKGRPETWNSGVQIKKCRYLEASGCVALCVNLCKVGRLTDS